MLINTKKHLWRCCQRLDLKLCSQQRCKEISTHPHLERSSAYQGWPARPIEYDDVYKTHLRHGCVPASQVHGVVNGLDESGHALKRCLPFSDEAYGNGQEHPSPVFVSIFFGRKQDMFRKKSRSGNAVETYQKRQIVTKSQKLRQDHMI